MKLKVLFVLFLFFGIVAIGLFMPTKKVEYDYLRIHIRANSNCDADQNVKYLVKNQVVEYLTPYFCDVTSKTQAIKIVQDLAQNIEKRCNKVLNENGFCYTAKVKINNEYFPTRTYANTTLNSGYYDAVIVELGSASGDNWWCVMYPPLCFVNKNETNMQIKYKSKIKEWFSSLFN